MQIVWPHPLVDSSSWLVLVQADGHVVELVVALVVNELVVQVIEAIVEEGVTLPGVRHNGRNR